jgi:hypothetical protein
MPEINENLTESFTLLSMAQLEKTFGEQALSPIDTYYLGWARTGASFKPSPDIATM